MKTMSNWALAVLVASAFILGGDNSSNAETGAPTLTATELKGNYLTEATGAVEKRDLVVTRVFDAPVDQVWKAWTDAEYVMRWWGPTGFTACACKVDFREGGKFVFCMRAPKEMGGQDMYSAGVYKKIVPMQRIEFSQYLSDKDGNRIDPTSIGMPADFPREIPSALAFKRIGDKTELTATEYDWTVGQMLEMSEAGLNQCLDKLADVLAERK
ncbi:MAG TPA: SRPBCC domain-containing protein [Blastocatellia bacterium]|nr:SRPBCC domain-containing protein [Blastocatellia bacterium]